MFTLAVASPAAAQTIKVVSEKSSFQLALEGPRPVLVLFQGKRCAPCRAVEHWLDQLSGEIAGKVDVVSLDFDDNPYTRQEFGVTGTPTLIMFRDGEQTGALVGATQLTELRSWIATSVSAVPAVSSDNPR